MGVPSFYRWLVGKYPKSVVRAVDDFDDSDSNNPNPNGEFDNLYLDLNGIVHPCFHPDDETFGPTTLDEVFLAIFEYIDHLFSIVRPRKLLFLAVDGVAPRAKLNQQRARRYRTAKDSEIAEIEEKRLRKEFERAGKELLPKQEPSDVCDSNVITPGTVFMQKLSTALEYYIRLRLNNDPSWKSILVIFSDANVPGEGEHKIMSFIRLQRSLPGYDPITRHCLYGLDADLIMLALATHEIHFSILREDVFKKNEELNISTFVASSSQEERDIFKTRQWFKQIETTHRRAHKKPYQLLNIWTFREYLELDMMPECQSVVDIERIVDDFIFICFFSGNDFLPHLPSIEIHEGGIDLLIEVYKKMFKSMGGYLVDTSRINERSTSYINFQGVKIFISEIGSYEDRIFVKRYTLRKMKLEKLLRDRENEENHRIDFCNSEFSSMEHNFNGRTGASAHILYSFSEKCNVSSPGSEICSSIPSDDVFENTKEFKRVLRQFIRDKSDLFKNTVVDNDKVKLGCFGWRARYYRDKFSAENAKEIEAKRIALVQKYVEGFCWVLKYYFTGVCSWSWYYPFYYGPFASDFKDLCFTEVSFTIGMPFDVFDQLMAVLPPRSSHALPKAYRSLMNDDDSPINSFYPLDFMVDNDGKRFAWQGVCKLPFIEEPLLLEATKNLHKELQDDEVERNSVRNAKAFVTDTNSLFTQICLHPRVSGDYPSETQNPEVCGVSCGINCFLSLYEESSALSNFTSPISGMEDISSDRSRCATFFSQEPQTHITRLLTAENIPEKTIQKSDIVQKMLWHEYPGHAPPHSVQPQRYVPQTLQSPNNWKGAGRGKPVIDASFPLTSYDYGRGRGIRAPMVTNWGRGIEKPASNNYEYHVRRHGQFSSPSVFASTSYDHGRGRGTRSPMVANWERGVVTPSSNYYEYHDRGVGYQGRGRGTNYYGSQGRGREGHHNSMWVPRKSEPKD